MKFIPKKLQKRRLLIWGMAILFVIFYFSLPTTMFPKSRYSTVLLDNQGRLLSASISIDEQWHFPATEDFSNKYKEAAIAFEDKRFRNHWGVDFIAFTRALKDNIWQGRIVSGASTITMQTIRLHQGNPPRTIVNKLIEMWLSLRIEWKYSKKEILAYYAHNAPFGGNVIGIDAACWRYYNKSATNLSWGEAALLAVLPNSPGLIHTEKNRHVLKLKRNKLLKILLKNESIDKQTYELAIQEIIPRRQQRLPNLAPHLLQNLRKTNGAQLYKTTLDKDIQKRILEIASTQGRILKQNNIDNLAIVVLDIETNETVAYIGNLHGTGSKNQEYVDLVRGNRSTGSLLKPFLYTAALDEGIILEKSFLPDYPFQINGFVAENYYNKHDGLVPANIALIRSLNIPFSYLLQQYGIDKFLLKCHDLKLKGINKNADHYGIPLILGGAEANLWDLTNAYAYLGKVLNTYQNNDGYYSTEDYEQSALLGKSPNNERPKHALQAAPLTFRAESIWKALDNIQKVVRPNEQGQWQKFSSSRKIAWKTGTSNGFKDAWAIGVNSKYAIGVWVGNADGEGRPGIIGSKAAAPIFFRVLNNLNGHKWFTEPIDDMRKMAVCQKSGMIANQVCPIDSQWISRSAHHLKPCQYHYSIFVDETKNFQVAAQCYDISKATKKSVFRIPSRVAFYYRRHTFYDVPPVNHPNCQSLENKDKIGIIYPESGAKIFLPKIGNGIQNKFVLQAFHENKDAEIYWHIDDQFCGKTKQFHEINKHLSAGKHIVYITDKDGNEDKVNFEIME